MDIISFGFALVIAPLVRAQDAPTSLLTDAIKQEIHDRAKAEAMAREAKRSQERLAKFRQELDRSAAEIRQKAERARAEQQKWAAQLQALERETSSMKSRERELKRQLAEMESTAAAKEAEALKAKTELETLKQKLADSTQDLEERRKITATKMEQDQADAAQWAAEIKRAQDDLANVDRARLEYEKTVAVARTEAEEARKKLTEMKAEKETATAADRKGASTLSAAPDPNWKVTKLCNIYESPDGNSKKLAKIPPGAAVRIESESGMFVKTEFKGMSGYIRKICGQY